MRDGADLRSGIEGIHVGPHPRHLAGALLRRRCVGPVVKTIFVQSHCQVRNVCGSVRIVPFGRFGGPFDRSTFLRQAEEPPINVWEREMSVWLYGRIAVWTLPRSQMRRKQQLTWILREAVVSFPKMHELTEHITRRCTFIFKTRTAFTKPRKRVKLLAEHDGTAQREFVRVRHDDIIRLADAPARACREVDEVFLISRADIGPMDPSSGVLAVRCVHVSHRNTISAQGRRPYTQPADSQNGGLS